MWLPNYRNRTPKQNWESADHFVANMLILVMCGFLATRVPMVTAMYNCPSPCTCPNSTSEIACVNLGLSEIPRNMPRSLTTVDVSGNPLHQLTTNALHPLRSVVAFTLNNCSIEVIHDGAFAHMESLQSLHLSGNNLSTVHHHTFRGAENLVHLDLSNNQLTKIDGAFAQMTKLSRLDISHNRLTQLTQFTFRDLTDLRYLLLSNNQISEIDRRSFRNLEKLMYLVLKANPIDKIHRFQFNSYFLSYVDLSQCGLKRLPRGIPNSIRYLQLRRNNMTSLSSHSFRDCPHVSILVLDENGLTNIQDRTFEHMTYLQQLWLNNNKLSRIPRPLPPNLQRLLMDANNIVNVTDVFPSRSHISTLSLMGNQISFIASNALHKLTKLESLDLSNNQLWHIGSDTFAQSSQLKTLQLSKNPLQYFPSHCLRGLIRLKTLSIAYISGDVSIHPEVFEDMQKLQKLDLDSSPSAVKWIISTDALISSLGSVRDISMQSSDLTHIRSDFPDYFPNLAVLHISSGRWHCDSSMIWLRNWLLATPVRIENKRDITCFTPHVLHGRAIVLLSDYDFVPATTIKTSPTMPDFPTSFLKSAGPQYKYTTPFPVTEASGHGDSDEDLDEAEIDELIRELTESKLPTSVSPVRPTTKVISWEEYMKRSSHKYQSTNQTANPGYYDSSGRINGEVEILPINSTDSTTTNQASSSQNSSWSSNKENMTIIVIVTTLATVIVASILITTIVYLIRKQKRKDKPYQNGIKYQQRNDLLYFMPNPGAEGSTTDSLKTTSSKDAAMSLVPGRDINHEGPLRVYKWEDF